MAEVLCGTPEVRRMIDERASVLEMQNRAKELGMIDLRGSCLLALAQGLTSVQEIMRILDAGSKEFQEAADEDP